jgi:4-diphosphocytidyl-2-C-methyl-D-erythritol kinase
MRLLAPAKINLHLRVGPVDGTGYHPLASWMCTVGLFDTLTIERAEAGQFSLECDDPALPCDATNLVIRAAQALARESAVPNLGMRARLEKRIATGGGLGGGSSDAVRTLLGLNRLWNLNWPVERLSRIAATLGSDVPFFLHGPSSICTGRGQIVRPLSRPKPRWVVLVLPGYAVSTAAAYREFDRMGIGQENSIVTQPPWQQWAELSAGPLLSQLVNDLERPSFALCPQLARLRARVEMSVGRIVRMTGSGSSLFTLFDEQDEAMAAAARIQALHSVGALVTELAPMIDDDLAA